MDKSNKTLIVVIVAIVLLVVAVQQKLIFSGSLIEGGTGSRLIFSQNFDSSPTNTPLEYVNPGTWWCTPSQGCYVPAVTPSGQLGAGYHPANYAPPYAGMFVSDHSMGTGKSLIGYSYAYYEIYDLEFPSYYNDFEYDIDFQLNQNITSCSGVCTTDPSQQLLVVGTYHQQGPSGTYVYIKGNGYILDVSTEPKHISLSDTFGVHTLSSVYHAGKFYKIYLDGVEISSGTDDLAGGVNRISFGPRGRDSSNPIIGWFDNIKFTSLEAQVAGDGVVTGFEVCDPALDTNCAADGMSFVTTIIANCSDGIMNQDETAIDCGGAICSACQVQEQQTGGGGGGGGKKKVIPVNETTIPVTETQGFSTTQIIAITAIAGASLWWLLKKKRR